MNKGPQVISTWHATDMVLVFITCICLRAHKLHVFLFCCACVYLGFAPVGIWEEFAVEEFAVSKISLFSVNLQLLSQFVHIKLKNLR